MKGSPYVDEASGAIGMAYEAGTDASTWHGITDDSTAIDERDFVEIGPAPEGGTPFALDPYRVNGMLGSLARAKSALRLYDSVAERRINEINAEIIRNREPLVDRVEQLTAELENVAAFIYEANPRTPVLTLPNGRIGSGAGGVEWVWPEEGSDEATALLAWLTEHKPEVVSHPPAPPAPPARPDKVAAKAWLKAYALADEKGPQKPAHPDGLIVAEGGEIVPGVKVVARPRNPIITLTPVESGVDLSTGGEA